MVIALAGALLAPLSATATDSDLKHAFAFRVAANNGYSILALAESQRADGRGDIALFVDGKGGGATYLAPATLTATRIDADLGSLGRVALDVVPSGRKRKLRSRCGDGREAATFEPQSYRGIFEFHGEEGYADAVTSSPREYTHLFLDLLCGGAVSGEFGGADLPGARLRLRSRRGSFRLALQANENHPGARARLEVETREEHQGIEIARSRALWAGSGAFAFDPRLRMAMLAPPAPFSGHASYRRAAAPANRWSGNLTVDLPGRSNLSLTGPGVAATLAPACWQGEGAGGRADCGFDQEADRRAGLFRVDIEQNRDRWREVTFIP
jgi:hypothetical protein